MRQAKFSMNALLTVVLIFSVIAFFFTIVLARLADRTAVNDYYRIEGTELGIRYSNKKESGLYEGPENTGILRLEGSFGHDWGIAMEGENLYLNEYITTDLGMTLCRLIRVNTDTFEKEILLKNTVLRGRCASGELVCMSSFFLPSVFPETNELCRLYSLTDSEMIPGSDSCKIVILDPATAEVLYEAIEEDGADEYFEERYLGRTLEEIRNDAGGDME